MRVVYSQEHRVAAENQGPKRFQKPERRVATEMRAVCSQEHRVATEKQEANEISAVEEPNSY